jgi:hypothetical protein
MEEGLHFPLLISGPKEVPITAEQHSKLSYIGLASFMLTYPICVEDKGDHVLLYCPEWRGNYFHTMSRFKEVIPGRINGSAELAWYTIPKTTKLYETLNKYFKHLWLK